MELSCLLARGKLLSGKAELLQKILPGQFLKTYSTHLILLSEKHDIMG